MVDYRTRREQKRDELHERVCNLYRKMKDDNVSFNRKAIAIGEEVDITRVGVVRILTQHGLYTPKSRNN